MHLGYVPAYAYGGSFRVSEQSCVPLISTLHGQPFLISLSILPGKANNECSTPNRRSVLPGKANNECTYVWFQCSLGSPIINSHTMFEFKAAWEVPQWMHLYFSSIMYRKSYNECTHVWVQCSLGIPTINSHNMFGFNGAWEVPQWMYLLCLSQMWHRKAYSEHTHVPGQYYLGGHIMDAATSSSVLPVKFHDQCTYYAWVQWCLGHPSMNIYIHCLHTMLPGKSHNADAYYVPVQYCLGRQIMNVPCCRERATMNAPKILEFNTAWDVP